MTPLPTIGQRPPIRGQGLQGVHPGLANEPRVDQPLLSPIQREAGTLPSDAEVVGDSAENAAGCGRRAPGRRRVHRALQPGAPAQRDRVHRAGGPTGRTAGGHLGRARPQTGRGEGNTSAQAHQRDQDRSGDWKNRGHWFIIHRLPGG